MEVVIRRARRTEGPELAELFIRARAAAVPAIPPSVHHPDEIRRHFAATVVDERETWVATVDDEIRGLLVLHDQCVNQLYCDPGWTGRQLGSALLDRAKTERPGGLELWAFESNTEALRFYRDRGFVAVERTDGSGNEEQAPDVRMVWEG